MMDEKIKVDYFDYLLIKDFDREINTLSLNSWNKDDLLKYIQTWCKVDAHDCPVKKLMMALRQVFTGRREGPSVSAIMDILGKEECLNRIKIFIEMCENNLPNHLTIF